MALVLVALGSNAPNAAPTLLAAATAVIPPTGGDFFVTYAGVCAATLAVPAADGLEMRVTDLTGHAHTITTPASGLNGVDHIATFGGTVLSYTHLKSFGGQWIQYDETGITLS